MGILTKAAKGVGKAPATAVRLIVPKAPGIEEQLEKSLRRPDIQEAYRAYKGDPEDFKKGLRAYLEQVDNEHRRLYGFARTLDSVNRATIPIDGALDYLNLAGGIGAGARAIKTLATLPGYLAYDAYYTAKTGDVVGGLIVNPAYEVLSWAALGSLPHLVRRYTTQLNKKTIEEASRRFLKRLNARNLEDKVAEPDVAGIIEPEREKRRRAA